MIREEKHITYNLYTFLYQETLPNMAQCEVFWADNQTRWELKEELGFHTRYL